MIAGQLTGWRSRFGGGLVPRGGMREAMQWLMLARLGVLFSVLTVVVLQQVFRREVGAGLVLGYGLLALSFAFNLFHSSLLERLPQGWGVAASHIVFDALVTSAWIYWSGARDSLFALFYLIQILIVSLLFYQRGAWLAALVSCIVFGLTMAVAGQPRALLNWSIYSAMFLTLGIVGGYLSEELLRTNERLTEKSRSMEKLMALQERIIAGLPTGLLTVDHDMRINFINPAGEHILGRTGTEIVDKPLADIEAGLLPFFQSIEAEDVKEEEGLSATGTTAHRSFFVRSAAAPGSRLQQRVEVGHGTHARILRGDVADLDADAGVSGLLGRDALGGRVLLFQDVTKLVHLEDKLKQSEKLAAVGQLAAGIAHEIRNPLASMSASIEMLKGSLFPEQRENQKLMDIAIREIDRLNGLISEFLDFVKPDKFKVAEVQLPKLLGEIALVARGMKDFKERITIDERFDRAPALGNEEKLRQVIWNFVMNAMQAMKKGGTIEVGCGAESAQKVKFWVQDQGMGMSEEVLSHLYEPFFTTKEKGTGLGLATAYKIIEAHHGEIRVTSTVGVGTRFEVILQSA